MKAMILKRLLIFFKAKGKNIVASIVIIANADSPFPLLQEQQCG